MMTEGEMWERRNVKGRIEAVRVMIGGLRDFLDRFDVALVDLEKAMGYQTGPESSREEMSPKLNGTLDCPSAPLAAAEPEDDRNAYDGSAMR